MTILTPTKHARIRDFLAAGLTQTEIANKFGVHHSQISRIILKLRKDNDNYNVNKKPGCPPIFNDRDLRRASRAITSGQCSDATEVRHALFPHVSVRTVQRGLSSISLKGRICRTKPLLRPIHIMKRRMWEKTHRGMEMEKWKTVIFSDESKYNLFGSDGK